MIKPKHRLLLQVAADCLLLAFGAGVFGLLALMAAKDAGWLNRWLSQ